MNSIQSSRNVQTFQRWWGRVEVKLMKGLSVTPAHMFNVTRNKQMLPQLRKIMKEIDKLKQNKH